MEIAKERGKRAICSGVPCDSDRCREITRQEHSKTREILSVNKKKLSFHKSRDI